MKKIELEKQFQKYPEYKNSMVDWIGKIPKDWAIVQPKKFIKRHFSGIWGDEPKADVNDVPCLRVADFNYEKLGFGEIETVRNIPQEDQKKKLLKTGDILLEKSGGGEKQPVGRAILFNSSEKMVCANFIEVIEVKDEMVPKYFTYFLSTAYSTRLNDRSIKQTTGIQNLDLYNYFSEYFVKPTKIDQQKIADFLDAKTEIVDKIIEQKEKLIELLKEKRAAVINKAVTRGLNKNVELVDSGVEWVGKVPKEWKMRKVSRSFNIIGSGTTPSSTDESLYDDGDVNWVNTGDLNDGALYETAKKITSDALSASSTLRIYPVGTLLIALYGATIGKVALLGIQACTNQACCALAESPYFVNKFVYYWFLGNKQNIIDNFAYGGGQPNISQNVIKSLKIPAPLLSEQREIIKNLDGQINGIEIAEGRIKKSIELLQEYKSSLIYNVVTGKVKI